MMINFPPPFPFSSSPTIPPTFPTPSLHSPFNPCPLFKVAPLNPARGSEDHCELLQWGFWMEPSCQIILVHLSRSKQIMWTVFISEQHFYYRSVFSQHWLKSSLRYSVLLRAFYGQDAHVCLKHLTQSTKRSNKQQQSAIIRGALCVVVLSA